jgi:purine-nucleoside phosphorylase
MQNYISLAQIDETVQKIKSQISIQPVVGIILGSGLNGLADSVQSAVTIAYSDLPNFPVSTVHGHVGRFVIGELEGKPVLVMQGRIHYYEGYTMGQVTLPVRVMQRMGIPSMIVTNAAGGVHPDFEPGDVMLITDQLNLMGMSGLNPLMGPNLDEVYSDLARNVAKENGINLREGIYAGLSGPSFESPADLRFLRNAGVDAVGMSTVPEVIVARHGNMRVLGLSGISNKANLDGSTITTHEEVIEAGKVITPKVEKIVRGVLRGL